MFFLCFWDKNWQSFWSGLAEKSFFYTAVRNVHPRGLIIQVLINIYKYKYNSHIQSP